MNLLHVHSGNIFGGVERMLEALAPATAGRAPICSSYAVCFEGAVSESLRAAGADVYMLGEVHARRPGEIRGARRRLRALLPGRNWDLVCVHSAWTQALLGPVVRRTDLPMVRWLHSPDPGPWWLESWASRSKPHLFLCNSHYTLSAARARLGATPAAVHYPPARLQATDAGARALVRSQLGTRADAVVIAIAARLEPWKGHDLLIESLAATPGDDWELWVIGGPQRAAERSYFDSLVRQASRAGLSSRVRFLGQRPDVWRFLQAADIYCQPNRGAEPFGLSFIEALAAGLPVVTTRLGAAEEIVDERCGVLVEPSVPAVAGALQALLASPHVRRAKGTAALARARDFCDLSASLRRLAAELGRVASYSVI